MNSRTPDTISSSIRDFRETSPDGKLIQLIIIIKIIYFQLVGTKIEKVKGNNNTLINNTLVPNTTHTTIDNNKNVNDQIIKDVQKVISQ